MLRVVLLLVLIVFIARAFWRVVDGIVEGVAGVPQRRVQLARDPVCGTFVVPNDGLSLSDGGATVFFCSRHCRDEYRSGPSTGSSNRPSARPGRPVTAQGRTA